MARSVGASAQFEVAAAFEHAVEEGFGEVGVVQDAPPGGARLVRREDHGPLVQVPVVDDLKEDVGGIRAVAEIADLVDHEHGRVRVGGQDRAELARASPPRDLR